MQMLRRAPVRDAQGQVFLEHKLSWILKGSLHMESKGKKKKEKKCKVFQEKDKMIHRQL